MERDKLKTFVMDEFKKDAQKKNATGEGSVNESGKKGIDEALLEKMIDEFCAMNPMDLEVLNVFTISDEQVAKIKQNPGKELTSELIARLEYGQIINNAGLAYKKFELGKFINELSDMVSARND